MLKKLSSSLQNALKQIRGHSSITESNINSTVKEIKRILIQSDVDYKVAKEITDKIKEESIGRNVLKDISPRQLFIKIVNEQLVALMGGNTSEIQLNSNPSIILLCGLQGVGKTTLAVKLAKHLKKKGQDTAIAACDIYRPAAIEQLRVFANSANIPVYYDENLKDAVTIAEIAIQKAKQDHKKVLIIDTAGRLSIDKQMMKEVINIKNISNPSEILFVVDSMVGQDAINTARAFNESLDFSGLVLTKLDGDTKGGVALSISYDLKKPIKFISVGEKIDDLDVFHPDRMASRILGMGDVVSFVEKAEELFSEEEEKKIEKRIKEKKFDYNDLRSELRKVKKLGSVQNIVSMIPGLKKLSSVNAIDFENFNKFDFMIDSMTPFERTNPDKIDKSRVNRIVKGSGLSLITVQDLMKKMDNLKKFMIKMQKDKAFFNSMADKFKF